MSTTILEYKNKVNTLTKRVKDFESGTATAAIEELKKAVDTVSNRKGSVKLNGSFVGSPESKKETDPAVVPVTSQPEDPTKLKTADESAVGDAGQSEPKTAGSS
jgi:hypothetical protein